MLSRNVSISEAEGHVDIRQRPPHLGDCPYLCDDGLLWKSVPRERVVDMATVPLDDGDDEWLQQEVFVVADGCFYCN